MLKVRIAGDEFLSKKSEDVVVFDNTLKIFTKQLVKAMRSYNGIGLAAPQVGRLINVFAIDIGEIENKKRKPVVFINPKVLHQSGLIECEEGCLSVPGVFAKVQRSEKIAVVAKNAKGVEFTIKANGLFASAIQHEIDHLNGKLFYQRLSKLRRIPIQGKIKRMLKKAVAGQNIREPDEKFD